MKLLLGLLLSFNALAFDPTVTLEYEVREEMKRTNVLFVIDNSGSMTEHQEALADLSKNFLTELKDIYFKITAISTDKEETLENLVIYKKMENPLDKLYKLLNSFGNDGSATELVFERATAFFNSDYGKTFARGNGPIEIIALSDEEEQSPVSVDEFIQGFGTRKIYFNGIVQSKAWCTQQNNNNINVRYVEAANKTGGTIIDLCQGVSQMSVDYEKLAQDIAARAKAFGRVVPVKRIKIEEKIDINSIKVSYGSQKIERGLIDKGWVFNVSKNEIIIGNKVVLDINQAADTKLTIQYEIL